MEVRKEVVFLQNRRGERFFLFLFNSKTNKPYNNPKLLFSTNVHSALDPSIAFILNSKDFMIFFTNKVINIWKLFTLSQADH